MHQEEQLGFKSLQEIPSNETIELTGLNDLNAGIYFVEVEMGSKKAVQKLVK